MVEDKRNAMIPQPSGAIEKIGPGPRGILTRMVSDTLALARSQSTNVAAARFKIGKYEFCDPDYRQILLWARALKLKPLTIVQRLERSSNEDIDGNILNFGVDGGSITALIWDFDLLPLTAFRWIDGLMIRKMVFQGRIKSPFQHSLRLPSLTHLKVSIKGQFAIPGGTELDLSCVPMLTELDCSCLLRESHASLDLSNVPNLTKLYCRSNYLTDLDLSKVPKCWRRLNIDHLCRLNIDQGRDAVH